MVSANLPPSEPRSTIEAKEVDDDEDDIVSYTGSFVEKKKKMFTPNPRAPAWTPARKVDNDMETSVGSNSSKSTQTPRGAPLYPRSDSTRGSSNTPRGAPLYPPSESNYGPLQSGTPAAKRIVPHFAPVPSISEASSEIVPFPSGPPSFPGVDVAGRTVYPEGNNEPFGSCAEDALGNPDAVRDWEVDDVRSAMNHLYELAKGIIVNQFREGTPNVPDSKLPTEEKKTWLYLLDMVYPGKPEAFAHMKFLIGVSAFRPYILERMMLDYIFRKVMAPVIFLGFTPQMDSHLSALQKQMTGFASKTLLPTLAYNRSYRGANLCFFLQMTRTSRTTRADSGSSPSTRA